MNVPEGIFEISATFGTFRLISWTVLDTATSGKRFLPPMHSSNARNTQNISVDGRMQHSSDLFLISIGQFRDFVIN